MVDGRPYALVSDTGVGVPAQERDKIFDRFYRGERSAQTPGHGLGLSIAATIAKLHGFALTVGDNNPGARFELNATSSAAAVRIVREPA
jgi:signal transduction histidine kinase